MSRELLNEFLILRDLQSSQFYNETFNVFTFKNQDVYDIKSLQKKVMRA